MKALILVITALVAMPQDRAAEIAHQLTEGANLARVDLGQLTALAYYESTLDHNAVSKVGAVGLMQLHPKWYGRLAKSECAMSGHDNRTCELLNVRWGAWALRDALQACGGSYLRAFGKYRTGSCRAGPKARATVQLGWRIAFRLKNPSTRPLLPRPLP